jgi:hypothetical protein
MPVQDAYFNIYLQADKVINSQADYDTITHNMTALINSLWEITDYNYLTQWTLTMGNISYGKNMTETVPERYIQRLTYVRAEYDELVVLAMFLKMVTPIWSMYTDTPTTLDTGYKEINALELLEGCPVTKIPAMVRLADYCSALVEKESEGLSSALVSSYIGSNELPRYFLALALVRRVSVGELRNPEATLIKITCNFLNSHIKNLTGGVQRKRRFNTDSDDEDNVAERYRISQEIPDYVIVVEEAYILDVERFVADINPEGTAAKAKQYIAAISKNGYFTISNYHVQLCGLICDRVISSHTFPLLSREARLTVIGVTAAHLSDVGLQDVANLLLGTHYEKDPETMDMHSLSGFAFSPLSPALKDDLTRIYPYLQLDSQNNSRGNPGITMIEDIITEINSYMWDENLNIPQQLRNIIATMIVQREDKLCLALT